MSHVIRTEPITLEEFEAELRSWDGVPYQDCGQTKGGIDCLRFLIVIQDWLHGWDTAQLPPIPKKPPQTAINDPRTAFEIVKWVSARYPNEKIWDHRQPKEDLQSGPGDVFVVRNQEHPGHALIGGLRPYTCWHATNDLSLKYGGNVHETSVGWCFMTGLVQVNRMKESLLQC